MGLYVEDVNTPEGSRRKDLRNERPGEIVMRHFDINDAGDPEMGSLEESDRASAAKQKTPNRVPLEYLRKRIVSEEYWHPTDAPYFTVCCLFVDNGYILIGKSAPADPENFDEELGKRFAREDAERQFWPILGFVLREQLHNPED